MKPDFSKIVQATAGKTKTTGVSPFSELEISKVFPNPEQPRKSFEDIEELASTILEHGLLQPITVVKKDDGYMIISGERRYKAHLINKAKTIKAYILDATDDHIEELSLIENIQRNDLTDFETAKHIVKLWETGRYTKKSDLAAKLGKPLSYVSKAFSSLKLDSEIIEDIEKNQKNISVSVMDEISRVKNKDTQKEVYEKYNAGEITRDEIKEFKPGPSEKESLIEFDLNIYDANNICLFTDKILATSRIQGLIKAYQKYPEESKDEDIKFDLEEVKEEINHFPAGKNVFARTGTSGESGRDIVFEDYGCFYFFNYGDGENTSFEPNKKYKITIEEI